MVRLILVIFLFTSCCGSKKYEVSQKSQIIYFFPTSVNNLISKELSKEAAHVYLCFYSYAHYFEVVVCKYIENGKNYYIRNTRHQAFINGFFIPIVFDTDMAFGITIDSATLVRLYSENSNPLLEREYTIHEGYYVRFKRNGEVLDSGYGISKIKN